MLPISSVVEVNGLDFDLRVKVVLVEQDSIASVVGNAKVIRETLVLEVLNRFVEGNDVPFACNVLFNGTFSASSRSRVPAQDAEACLLEKTVWHAVVEAILGLW